MWNFDISQIMPMVMTYAPPILWKVVAALAIWIIWNIVIKWAMKLVEAAFMKSGMDDTISGFLKTICSVLLKVLLLLTIAWVVWINTTSFAAILWAAGLAVWMALSWNLANFAAWVMVIMFKPYKVGDVVTVNGEFGSVKEIGVFTTTIITPENKTVIIPNGLVTAWNITNITEIGNLRVDVNVGIAYDENIDNAKSVLQWVVDDCEFLLKDPAGWVYVNELGDSSVNLIVRGFATPENYWNAYFAMTESSKKALDDANISIPFPHRVVHTVNG